MTILTTASSQTFPGNGVATSFPCSFPITANTDIAVSYVNPADGTETPLALNTDYTVSGAGGASFTVVTTVAVPDGTNLLVSSNLPLTQPSNFTDQGNYYPSMLQAVADRLCRQIQQVAGGVARQLTMPDGLVPQPSLQLPIPLAGSLLGWAEDESAIVNLGPSGVGAGSIFDANVASNAGIQATKLAYDDSGTGLGTTTVQGAIGALNELLAQIKPNNDAASVMRRIRDGEVIKIVCLGDSITWGYHPDGTQASQPYPTRLQNLLQQYYGTANVSVVNAGVPGNTVQNMIDRFSTDVAAQNPDLIIFNGGTNDAIDTNGVSLATYLSNVLQILKLAGSTPVVVMGLTPRFKEQKSGDGEGVIDFYRRTLKRVANYYSLPYIDTFSRLHKLYKSGGYRRGTLSTDGSHYTDDGYVLLGEIVFTEMFVNDDIYIQPGQFKDMAGQWIVTQSADSNWGGSDNVDGSSLVITANATVRLYAFLEHWTNAALVLHANIDNTNATGQSIAVQNQSITTAGVPSAPTRTFALSQKANGGTTSGFLNDYPIVTVKLRPGLNNITLTASANGARLTGFSVIPITDTAYRAPYVNTSHGGAGEALWGSSFNSSPQAYESLRLWEPLVISNASSYVQPYFMLVPDHDANTTRWRFRGSITPSTVFYLGQQQSTTLGVSYAYKLSFDGTNAKLEIQTHAGTLQTCATVALAITSTGQDVTVDITTGPTGWSVWVNGTLIYTDTIPLSMGQVYASTTNAISRTYLNPPIKKGPGGSDTGTLIGEQYISFVDGKLHFVTAGGTDKAVTFA